MSAPPTVDQFAKELHDAAWVTDLRKQALARHAQLPWPHVSDDIWRRTDVSLLDPAKGFAPALPSVLTGAKLTEAQLAAFTTPLGNEHLAVRVNGQWLTPPSVSGMTIEEFNRAATSHPAIWRRAIEADGLSEAEQKLTTLNLAFHHDDVAIAIPAGTTVDRPVRLVRIISAAPQQAIFPLTVITVGEGSTVTLVDEYISVPSGGKDAPHLINGRIELVLEPNATVRYVRLQRWDRQAREFLLQRATLGKGAVFTSANINLGAAVSKAHLVTKLAGERASARLYGFVFGHDDQHIDQHTLQDHQAPHTESDLQYRAALQDRSRMIYTGLIRIAREAAQTNAYQSNHNLMLSQDAKAEAIPMLEILADDVQCKHGASVGPIDEEQQFYLRSRGIPHDVAQRLIVMGFIEPIIQQIPFAPLQERLRQEIEQGLQP